MVQNNLKELSFLVYGLGLTGRSVVNFFKKNKFKNYKVWDDKEKNFFKKKRVNNLNQALKKVDFIVLSPGVNLNTLKKKNRLIKYQKKFITDLDLIFLFKKFFKSIVVTGTNGKSTTCKILEHVLNKNKFKTVLGGNIGTPLLNLNIKKNDYLVIEASSFQLAYSKFIRPNYAILLNITNDHLDWHGNMKNYINSKFKIFENQKEIDYSFVNLKFKKKFKKRKFISKLIIPNLREYTKLKKKINNSYLSLNVNDQNMSYIFRLSKLLKIKKNSFLKSLSSFVGLPHRHEVFFKKNNCTFINDSKATSFQATKFALKNSKNIFWIVGGLPKKNDKINLKKLKRNIVKTYIIGKNINYYKRLLNNKVNFTVTNNLKNSIFQISKDIKFFKKKNNTILLSPASASFDQYLNFENRGNEFKKLIKTYASKFI